MTGRPLLKFLALAAPLFCGALAQLTAGEEPQTITLVRMGGKHPYFVSLDISLNRRPWGESRTQQFQELFKFLDSDSNGSLEESELGELTRRGLPSFTPTDKTNWWKTADQSPSDGKISPEEFQALETVILGSPVQLQFLPPRQSQIFDLVAKLDADQDGKASFEEILQGSRYLAKYDLNEDGSVAVEELVPPGTAPIINNGSSADRIWMLVSERNRRESAERLMKEFDRLPAGSPDQQLSAEESGLTDKLLSQFDQDGNGNLNLTELEKLLSNPPPDLRVSLQLRANSFLRPKFDLESFNESIKPSNLENKSITPIDGVNVTWLARGTTITSDDARRFYRQRFIQADGDKNGYLSEQEFATLQVPNTPFANVDQNGDDQLFPEELLSYLKLQIFLTQGRVTLLCSNETRSLLELLDKDSDRRLSAGEFRNSRQNLAQEDRNGDAAISDAELAEAQSVVVEYNRSSILELAARSAAIQQQLRSITRQTLTGPIWYQKMDRNRDGFVTKKEFLGPLEVFSKMDANADGAIDEAEAEQGGT